METSIIMGAVDITVGLNLRHRLLDGSCYPSPLFPRISHISSASLNLCISFFYTRLLGTHPLFQSTLTLPSLLALSLRLLPPSSFPTWHITLYSPLSLSLFLLFTNKASICYSYSRCIHLNLKNLILLNLKNLILFLFFHVHYAHAHTHLHLLSVLILLLGSVNELLSGLLCVCACVSSFFAFLFFCQLFDWLFSLDLMLDRQCHLVWSGPFCSRGLVSQREKSYTSI